MRKLLLLLFVTSIFQLNAQSSATPINFDDYKTSEYSKIKITFGGKYNEEVWEFKSRSQFIYFTPADLLKAALVYEQAMNKALEWDKIADENNVEKLRKEMKLSFKTTRGMLEDSGYESVGTHNSKFEYGRSTSGDKTSSVLYVRIFQSGDYNVRSAFFNFPNIDLKNKGQMDKFYAFLDFMKNNQSIISEKLKNSKEDLFKD